jgi:hypothetical protein
MAQGQAVDNLAGCPFLFAAGFALIQSMIAGRGA